MNTRIAFAAIVFGSLALGASAARPQTSFTTDLEAVRAAWEIANYQTPADQRLAAFEKLVEQSGTLAASHPREPEVLIWDGIALSTYAGLKGGIGALAPAKAARARFEAAVAIDEKAMDGAAHTSLGTLYHKLPGFPIAFGSDKLARVHLEKALAISPGAVDANYFYGEFLYDEGDYREALQHLETARKAPARPGREIADAGRRQEIDALIAKTRAKLN